MDVLYTATTHTELHLRRLSKFKWTTNTNASRQIFNNFQNTISLSMNRKQTQTSTWDQFVCDRGLCLLPFYQVDILPGHQQCHNDKMQSIYYSYYTQFPLHLSWSPFDFYQLKLWWQFSAAAWQHIINLLSTACFSMPENVLRHKTKQKIPSYRDLEIANNCSQWNKLTLDLTMYIQWSNSYISLKFTISVYFLYGCADFNTVCNF